MSDQKNMNNQKSNSDNQNKIQPKNKGFAYVIRGLLYAGGLILLALGITLNTKSSMGVSPIISVSYTVSTLLKLNFANMTFLWYSIFVLVEIVLHFIGRKRIKEEGRKLYLVLLFDMLQIPLSLLFTRFMDVFDMMIPDYKVVYEGSFFGGFAWRLIILLIGLVLTGIGAVLSLDMRVIPNPGDGIVQAISDTIHKSVGLTKNCLDISCILISTVLGLAFTGHLVGVGIGSALAMIMVGRVMALFNHLFLKSICQMTGLPVPEKKEKKSKKKKSA